MGGLGSLGLSGLGLSGLGGEGLSRQGSAQGGGGLATQQGVLLQGELQQSRGGHGLPPFPPHDMSRQLSGLGLPSLMRSDSGLSGLGALVALTLALTPALTLTLSP